MQISRSRFTFVFISIGWAMTACSGESPAVEDSTSSPLTSPTCTVPIRPADVSRPRTVVGRGRDTCTEAALTDAVRGGGVITFNCGGAATIPITTTKVLPIDRDTVIDGGGLVTLDAGGRSRIFYFSGPDFRVTRTAVTLQNLTLIGGRSIGTALAPAPLPCAQGVDLDGGGAAVYMNDGLLRVINCTFANNRAGSPGPDVGGGAIYALGSLETTIVNSRFTDNNGANGGAVGSLWSNLTLVNNTFTNNRATGTGANSWNPSCPRNQQGSGGNGGAVSIDGGEAFTISVCGNTFRNNGAGALGGAIFRVAEWDYTTLAVDQTTLDGNSAGDSGGALYAHHANLTVTNTTLSNNTATNGGGFQADDTTVNFTNVTFAGNRVTAGLGGAFALFGNGGRFLNCTFANNAATGGDGYFAAVEAGGSYLTFNNSLFANNTATDLWNPTTCMDTGDGSNNLQWPPAVAGSGIADNPCVNGIRFADPALIPLGDRGGPTLTVATAALPSLVQVGTGCPATDQAGRPRRSPCTLGALER